MYAPKALFASHGFALWIIYFLASLNMLCYIYCARYTCLFVKAKQLPFHREHLWVLVAIAVSATAATTAGP